MQILAEGVSLKVS